jgi:hypothetical protein
MATVKLTNSHKAYFYCIVQWKTSVHTYDISELFKGHVTSFSLQVFFANYFPPASEYCFTEISKIREDIRNSTCTTVANNTVGK